jgi:amino acid transporter
MSTAQISFDAAFSAGTMRHAARLFRDYQFKRYGLLLVVACLVNALGLFLAVSFGLPLGGTFWLVAFVVVIGPIWLAYKYFLGPRLHIAYLQRVRPDAA